MHVKTVCEYGYIHSDCTCKGSKHIVRVECTAYLHKRKPKTEEKKNDEAGT